MAIIALVCGIVQILFGILSIPAIICGAIALKQTAARGERGRGMAIAGLVLGILGFLFWLILIIAIVGHKSS
ncbi:MAG: DUF4190 domain-containing protein [Streptosporangiaceae bacterium]